MGNDFSSDDLEHKETMDPAFQQKLQAGESTWASRSF